MAGSFNDNPAVPGDRLVNKAALEQTALDKRRQELMAHRLRTDAAVNRHMYWANKVQGKPPPPNYPGPVEGMLRNFYRQMTDE